MKEEVEVEGWGLRLRVGRDKVKIEVKGLKFESEILKIRGLKVGVEMVGSWN